jgi:hypothetical protein
MVDAAAVVAQFAMSIMNLWRQAYFFGEIKAPEACLLADDFENCQVDTVS